MSLDETAPTDEEIAGDAALPGWSDYASDDSFSSPIPHTSSLSSGGMPPKEPPEVTTGGCDDDDERRREREERIRRIREQYGFTLSKKPVTPEAIEGKKRYVADRTRETAIRNREIDLMLHGKERKIRAAVKKRKATIARKKREEAAQAARAAIAALRLCVKKNDSSTERHSVKAKPTGLVSLGISPGDELVFTPTGLRVVVVDDKTIGYKGKNYSLSGFTREFIPHRNASGAYQGPKYFSYKGKSLIDIRSAHASPSGGGEHWGGKTQLAKLIARRGGNEGAFGGILHFFNRKKVLRQEQQMSGDA